LKFTGLLRPEQVTPVQDMLNACKNPTKAGGILNVFCGGGKTTMALYIMCKLKKKTLIVVHKEFLLNQWKERIQQFVPEAKIGMLKAKTIDIDGKDVVLASLQSLSMKTYDNNIFDGFGLVVIDEVHHTSAEVFSKALRKVSFMYTIGLSATVKRKDGLSKVFMWYLGDIVFKASKRIDNVKVIVRNYYDTNPLYSREHYMGNDKLNIAKMINNVCGHFNRTEFLTKVLQSVLKAEPDRKVLILSDRRNHLETMKLYFDRLGIDNGLYYGGLKPDVLAESEKKQVILATFAIASEGYDQKGLDTLILASPKSDIIQSVGRILRDKENERRHVPLIIDIVDKFSIFERQGIKRLKYYNSNNYEIENDENDDHVDPLNNTSFIALNGECLL
jgi:superfamily II DNA or RNA helicase